MKENIAPLIFIWIGKKIPSWGFDSLKFASIKNPNRKIILLVDNNSYASLKRKSKSFEICCLSPQFLKKCNLASNHNLSNDFWVNTAKRLKILHQYAKKNHLKQFFHAEIDNLIFSLNSLEKKLNLIGKGFFAPKDSEERAIASLIFCNNIESINEIFKYFSPPFLAQSEMHALGIYSNRSQNFFSLPTESFIEANKKWNVICPEKTNGIFDAAAIGQYIFGIDPMHEPYRPLYNMFVNENVLIKFSDLIFYLENQNIYAYNKKTKKEFKIYNIHVHSKSIKKAESLINGDQEILKNLFIGKKTLIKNRHKIITGKIRFFLSLLKRIFRNVRNYFNENFFKDRQKNFKN